MRNSFDGIRRINIKVVKAKIEDVERLKPVALEWKEICNGKNFGLETILEVHLSDLVGLIERKNADLFLLTNDDEKVVGYLGITVFDSPLGNQKIGNEHYWFVSRENKGRGAMLLIRAAKKWAKEHSCSHIIFNASNLASDMHDRICHFYERIGLQKFETSYIKALR